MDFSITWLVFTVRKSGNHLPLLHVQFRITSSPGSPCGPNMPCAPGEPCKNAPWDIMVSTISFDHLWLRVVFIRRMSAHKMKATRKTFDMFWYAVKHGLSCMIYFQLLFRCLECDETPSVVCVQFTLTHRWARRTVSSIISRVTFLTLKKIDENGG